MPSFSFDKINRIITVAATDTEVTVQQITNAIRDWEDELINFDIPKVADAVGKEVLSSELQVGITLKLLNWKLKFEDRPPPDWVDCVVSGGNLVAVDGNNQPVNPIEPASYVTVTIARAVSAALLQELDILAIKVKTDNLPSDPADQSLVSAHIASEFSEIKGDAWTDETLRKIKEKIDGVGVPQKKATFKI